MNTHCSHARLLLLASVGLVAVACAPRTTSTDTTPDAPAPAPPVVADAGRPVPPPVAVPAPAPVAEPLPPPVRENVVAASSLDDLNRASPLQPVFFRLDSSDLDPAAQAVLSQNAGVLKSHPTWAVTIEGHCDERGTAEYNLTLGERRATAARAYLMSLGIPADRLRVISYGKEFPFETGHDEGAWSKNRRGHFVITAQ